MPKRLLDCWYWMFTLLFFINLPLKHISCLWSSVSPAKRLWMRPVMDQLRWELLAVSIGLDWAFTGYSHSAPEFPEFFPSSLIMPHHRGVSTCASTALQCVSVCAPSPYMETHVRDGTQFCLFVHMCPRVDRKTERWSVSMWSFSSTNENSLNPLVAQH